MSAIRIHLTRHGEVHNPQGLLYGRLPGYGLSARGHEMAERLAEHFNRGDNEVAALIASPLLRAQQTIAPLAAALQLAPQTDERVIEAANRFQGMVVDRSQLSKPGNLVHLYNPMRPSWGEPYADQVLRMKAAMASLRARLQPYAESGCAAVDGVIVSHQLPIWVTRLAAEGRRLWHDPRERECALASVTTFTYDGAELTDISYTDVCADLQPTAAVPGA